VHPHNQTVEKEFDIFSKAHRTSWAYQGSLKAESPEKAKVNFMRENAIQDPSKVAVYQKR
jgi:hypothetical protein